MSNERRSSGDNSTIQNSSWLQTAINNPVVGDLQRAIRTTQLRTGISTFLSNRQNSCPIGSLENSSDMDYRIRSTPGSSVGATVINIDETSSEAQGYRFNPRNFRRLSNSAGNSDNFAREIMPDLTDLATQLFNTNNATLRSHSPSSVFPNGSFLPSSSALNTNTANSSATDDHHRHGTQNAVGADDLSTATTSNRGTDYDNNNENGLADDIDQGHNYTIPPLRVLFQSREAVGQYIYQNFAEFPNLYGFNVSVLCVVVLTILFSQFLIENFTACGALILGLLHYQDASRFMRCISAIFHNEISNLLHPTFFSTVYRIVSTELFIMDVTLVCKLIISKNPMISKIYKRRVYQWLEYTSALYRYPISFVQWASFFSGLLWIVIYFIAKVLFGFPIVWSWLRTTIRLFHYSHLGTMPSSDELKNAEQCTICYGDFCSPIKLNCGHIFCSDCIRTWLDREVTCPICRATVSKEDNHYRNGNSIFPMHIF